MNRDPKHHEPHEHGHHAHAAEKKKWRPHHDWRVWVAVLVMLISMGVYIMTLNESFWPRGGGSSTPAPTSGGK